jgi:PAS domain S-box-containing protein
MTKEVVVLLADDDPNFLRLAGRALQQKKRSVVTVASGAEAIAQIQASTPDLVVLDLNLDDVEAGPIIRKLSAEGLMPPFIIVSANVDVRAVVALMKSGARDYLVKKPGFMERLPEVVDRVLEEIQREKNQAGLEAALRLSEERLRVALKHSAIAVFNQDAALRYTWVHNEAVLAPGFEFLGRTDAEIFSPDEADRLTQLKKRVLAAGTGIREELALTTGGGRRYLDLTLEPVRGVDGKIAGLTGAALETTGRKQLEREILQAAENEQQRIGQDLHDSICQHLAGIELKSQALAETLAESAKGPAAQAEKIASHVREVTGQIRDLARGLCPFILESEGLASALRELAASTESLFQTRCRFEGENDLAVTELAVATHLYRIAQEAVANAIKHGRARSIEISLTRAADKIVLAVVDDGKGFGAAREAGGGMGLRTMRYRASLMGASLTVQSRPRGGTKVVCFLHSP